MTRWWMNKGNFMMEQLNIIWMQQVYLSTNLQTTKLMWLVSTMVGYVVSDSGWPLVAASQLLCVVYYISVFFYQLAKYVMSEI